MIMTYNHEIEVIKLVQQCLPYIWVVNNASETKEIIGGIERNYQMFFEGV